MLSVRDTVCVDVGEKEGQETSQRCCCTEMRAGADVMSWLSQTFCFYTWTQSSLSAPCDVTSRMEMDSQKQGIPGLDLIIPTSCSRRRSQQKKESTRKTQASTNQTGSGQDADGGVPEWERKQKLGGSARSCSSATWTESQSEPNTRFTTRRKAMLW